MQIRVSVVPRSMKAEVIEVEGGYKIRVDVPASDGKANERLIELLSEYFKVKKSSVKILKGLKSRNKIVVIDK